MRHFWGLDRVRDLFDFFFSFSLFLFSLMSHGSVAAICVHPGMVQVQVQGRLALSACRGEDDVGW